MRWNDPKLRARNRRVIYILSLVSGSLLGAYMHRYSGKKAVITLAFGLKVAVTLWLAAVRGERDEESGLQDGCQSGAMDAGTRIRSKCPCILPLF
jgi:uncharacterized membrane protein YoaK (UPF0700 family)